MNKLLASTAVLICLAATNAQATVTFSTFVSGPSIAAVEGQNATIAFNYAGNKFVGSVYLGVNNDQLYSTNLTGGNVQKFGSPIPNGFSGEVVVAASLGQAGFAAGDIYAGAGTQIYHYANSGGAPMLFGTVPDGATVRQIFFDPGSSFGGNMLVTTTAGDIYKFNSAGSPTLVASTGEDTEGMDIATSAWGSFAGDLLTASEGSGKIRLVSPGGSITVINPTNLITEAETVGFVPLNLGVSGNPIEGLYMANYPVDIQFAPASQFAGLQGDAVIAEEIGGGPSPLIDVHYNAGTNTFSFTQVGDLPDQAEDGIFVTAARIAPFVPEPGSLTLLATGVGALAGLSLRRRRSQSLGR